MSEKQIKHITPDGKEMIITFKPTLWADNCVIVDARGSFGITPTFGVSPHAIQIDHAEIYPFVSSEELAAAEIANKAIRKMLAK